LGHALYISGLGFTSAFIVADRSGFGFAPVDFLRRTANDPSIWWRWETSTSFFCHRLVDERRCGFDGRFLMLLKEPEDRFAFSSGSVVHVL
jgi:hypothetical protein